MAIILASARFGSGRYGVSKYGEINLSKTLTGVSATGAVNAIGSITTDGATLSGVSSVGSIGTISPDLTVSVIGVSATSAVGSGVITATGGGLTGVQGTTNTGDTTETAVVFDYVAVKAQYSRKRCVYISRAA